MMNITHGMYSIKLIHAQQAKCVKNYKNTRLKLLKVSASVWFNKQCPAHHVTPKHAQVHLKEDVILKTNLRGDHHATLNIACCDWKLNFCSTCWDRNLKTSWCVGKLTVEMVLTVDGHNERRKASEY